MLDIAMVAILIVLLLSMFGLAAWASKVTDNDGEQS
ncbi:signal peptide protein [Paenibacillus sp. LHD-117]|nr:signal peptide protein [Paenibacillus sp. LHD-117]MDQ6419624.1 signal peptide protein [Paenibacillus sp. LHD-117]